MVEKHDTRSNILSDAARRRITAAIRKAEKKTGGEVYVVLAVESDDYFYPASLVMSFITLVLAIVCAFWMHWSWHDIALHHFGLLMLAFYLLSLVYLFFVPSLRLWLTPSAIKRQRAHLNAMRQFLAHNVHRTKKRTAVLLFASRAERYAEVIADTGINARVAPAEWQGIVDLLTDHARRGLLADGYIRAIDRTGEIVGRYFPPTGDDENMLPDHLVIL